MAATTEGMLVMPCHGLGTAYLFSRYGTVRCGAVRYDGLVGEVCRRSGSLALLFGAKTLDSSHPSPPPSPNLEYRIHTYAAGPLSPSFVDARKVLRYILEVSRPIPMPKNTII